MSTENLAIAIVDDDDAVRRALRRLVASLSYHSREFASGEAFLASLSTEAPFCALVDLHMPGMTGIDVLTQLSACGKRVPAIIITGLDEPRLQEKCLKAGASGYLVKPIERANLSAALQSLPRTGR